MSARGRLKDAAEDLALRWHEEGELFFAVELIGADPETLPELAAEWEADILSLSAAVRQGERVPDAEETIVALDRCASRLREMLATVAS